MKNTITTILVASCFFVKAQNLQDLQYGAYLKASKSLWERSISIAEKEFGTHSFEKAMAVYGLLNNTMATKDEDTFDDNVDEAVDLLKEIIEQDSDQGEAPAVLSSIYGLKMAYSPMKGIIYGSKSGSLMETAMKLQPESPLVQKLYGGSKLYTPEMFGGSAEKSASSFVRAISIYEANEDTNNWVYMDALVGLSIAYNKLEQKGKAKAILEKAVSLEPDFGWAKSLLEKANQ